jgi:hypothetical protein
MNRRTNLLWMAGASSYNLDAVHARVKVAGFRTRQTWRGLWNSLAEI